MEGHAPLSAGERVARAPEQTSGCIRDPAWQKAEKKQQQSC
jgi:hypothetical protein